MPVLPPELPPGLPRTTCVSATAVSVFVLAGAVTVTAAVRVTGAKDCAAGVMGSTEEIGGKPAPPELDNTAALSQRKRMA